MPSNVEIITQKKSDVVEIMISHLRSFDMATDDAGLKQQLDESLQQLQKTKKYFKDIENKKEQLDKMYEQHTMEKKDV